MNSLSLLPILRQAWVLWSTNLRTVALLAMPTLVMDVALDLVPPPDLWAKGQAGYMFALLLLGLPVFAYLFELSNAALYLWVRSNVRGAASPVASCFAEATRLSYRWYPPTLCAMSLIIVGAALILPAIYFFIVFSFVTACAIENQRIGWLDTLSMSRRLVHLHFWKILLVVGAFLLCDTVLSVGLSEVVHRLAQSPTPFWLTVVTRMGAILGGVVCRSYESVVLALLVMHLWREREQIRLRNSGKSGAIQPSLG